MSMSPRLTALVLVAWAAVAAQAATPAPTAALTPWNIKLPRKIAEGVECSSADRFIGQYNSAEQCGNAVGKKGGNYFSFGKMQETSVNDLETPSDASQADKDAAANLQAQLIKQGIKMMKVGACYIEYTYSDACEEGFHNKSYDFYGLDTYRAEVKMIEANKECKAKDKYLGKVSTLTECAQAVLDYPFGQFFVYGKGFFKRGQCYVKNSTHECPEGFEKDSFDFYGVKLTKTARAGSKAASRRRTQGFLSGFNLDSIFGSSSNASSDVAYKKLKSGVECKSKDSYVGWFSSVTECAAAVQEKGKSYFIYGSMNKMWLCYAENTASSDCTEGLENDSFDLYEITDVQV